MVTIGVLFTGSTSTLRNNVQQFSYAGIVYNPLKITKTHAIELIPKREM